MSKNVRGDGESDLSRAPELEMRRSNNEQQTIEQFEVNDLLWCGAIAGF